MESSRDSKYLKKISHRFGMMEFKDPKSKPKIFIKVSNFDIYDFREVAISSNSYKRDNNSITTARRGGGAKGHFLK